LERERQRSRSKDREIDRKWQLKIEPLDAASKKAASTTAANTAVPAHRPLFYMQRSTTPASPPNTQAYGITSVMAMLPFSVQRQDAAAGDTCNTTSTYTSTLDSPPPNRAGRTLATPALPFRDSGFSPIQHVVAEDKARARERGRECREEGHSIRRTSPSRPSTCTTARRLSSNTPIYRYNKTLIPKSDTQTHRHAAEPSDESPGGSESFERSGSDGYETCYERSSSESISLGVSCNKDNTVLPVAFKTTFAPLSSFQSRQPQQRSIEVR
jgi:hypothetical protein